MPLPPAWPARQKSGWRADAEWRFPGSGATGWFTDATVTIPALLARVAERRADRPVLVWDSPDGDGVTVTGAGLLDLVRRTAGGLAARGVGHGDRVLIHVGNSPQAVVAWLACSQLGAIAVSTNPTFTARELSHCAALVEPKVAFAERWSRDAVSAACPRLHDLVVVNGPVAAPSAPLPWSGSDWPKGGQGAVPCPWICRAGDVGALLFTSGTTALPKAVAFTHANLVWGASASARHAALGPSDVTLIHLPLHHVNGLIYSLLASFVAGARVVLMPKFSASRFWEVARRGECTWSSMVMFVIHLLKRQGPVRDHRFRGWAWGRADPAVDALFGLRTLPWYGMSETVSHPIVGSSRRTNPTGSMGYGAAGYEVAVVDADGRPAAPGEPGDLLVRGIPGVSLFAGYYGDDRASAAAFTPDGWFRTGDTARRLADGAFLFMGRHADILRVGGENMSPFEVETEIAAIPAVREVAVVGRADPLYGQVPVAVLLADDGEAPAATAAAVRERCRLSLAPHKHPRDIIIASALPRVGPNKIGRDQLRGILENGNFSALGVRGMFKMD